MSTFGSGVAAERHDQIFTYKVNGQVYHRVGSILPSSNNPPMCMQVYFTGYNGNESAKEEAQLRGQKFKSTDRVNQDVIASLQLMLHRDNDAIKYFKTALELMPADDYALHIKADSRVVGIHRGRLNAPAVNEVGVLIANGDVANRDILLHKRNNMTQKINATHRLYDPLQYPLLFPRGEFGYEICIPKVRTQLLNN